jgi:2'-5' RNA ligase
MSDYVVLARFDAEKDRQLKKLKIVLSDKGYAVPEWPPHITLSAYENFDEELLCKWTANFASKHSKQKIALHSVSVLPPGGEHTETAVVCLTPAHSKSFVDFYFDFHKKYEEYCTGIGSFNSITHTHGNPVIHVTIGIVKVAELQEVLELLFSQTILGEAEMTALEVYTYPMKVIKRFELN